MNNYRMKPLEDTRASKRRIMEQVEHNITQPTKKRRFKTSYAVVVALLLLCITFTLPMLKQTSNDNRVTVEKVELPDIAYTSLIPSQYVEETNELLIEEQGFIYIYDINTQTKKQVAAEDNGLIFNQQLSKDWFTYEHLLDDEQHFIVYNRKTNSTDVIDIEPFGMPEISGDYILYIEANDVTMDFTRYNLLTNEKNVVQSVEDFSSLYMYAQQQKLITVEEQWVNKHYETTMTVYDVESLQQLGSFTTDFRSIHNIQVVGNELFMLYIDEDRQKIGSYHLQKEQFTHYPLDKKIDEFATDGHYFAIAIGAAGKSKVQLYQRHGTSLRKTDDLDHIKERTVLPRLYGNTFMMIGEAATNPLYFIRPQ